MLSNFIKKRIINTIKYSLAGIKATWKTEIAFRLEILLGTIGGGIILFSNKSYIEKILLLNSILLLLIVELLNTGLEKTIDKISFEKHPISKIVKDVGSASVFIGLINLISTWVVIFFF